MCQACQEGKQSRKTTGGSKTVKTTEGALSKKKLQPGDLVFTDQYESSMPGRYYNDKGQMNVHHQYAGGTIFYDVASKFIYLGHQVGFTAEETVMTKMDFEREALGVGVTIKKYSSDNGVYVSEKFKEHLKDMKQTIQHCGVGGHHHNAHAENGIKIVSQKARTMLFHCALCCPEETNLKL